MCLPLALIPVAMAAVSAITAVGTGVIGLQQANSQAKVAGQNAVRADEAAQDALERGSELESQRRRESGQLYGQQIARMAANGIDISFGSPLKVLSDTKVLEEEDARRTLVNAGREAAGYDIEAASFRAEASNTRQAGIVGLGTSILGAATTAASGVSQFRLSQRRKNAF